MGMGKMGEHVTGSRGALRRMLRRLPAVALGLLVVMLIAVCTVGVPDRLVRSVRFPPARYPFRCPPFLRAARRSSAV